MRTGRSCFLRAAQRTSPSVGSCAGASFLAIRGLTRRRGAAWAPFVGALIRVAARLGSAERSGSAEAVPDARLGPEARRLQ